MAAEIGFVFDRAFPAGEIGAYARRVEAAGLDQLVRDSKTLRGSIEPSAGGGSAFIAQVTLYSAALGVAISQACYATGETHERAVLRQLLGELDTWEFGWGP